MASENLCITGNISQKGQQRRLMVGVAATLVVIFGLWLTPAGWSRLWLFFPTLIAISGFAQAQQKT